MECIDHQGEVKLRNRENLKNSTLFNPMELIEVSKVKSVDIPYEIYEAAVDAAISAAYCCESSEVGPD